jgi:acyl transferase domain-containing protein
MEDTLRREKIAFATMGVECMPHTPMVNAGRFADMVRHIPSRRPSMPLYSSVTGGRVDGEIGTDFWARMCSAPAMFRSMHDAMHADGHRDFVSVGSVVVERVMFASLPSRERPRMVSAAQILASARGKST